MQRCDDMFLLYQINSFIYIFGIPFLNLFAYNSKYIYINIMCDLWLSLFQYIYMYEFRFEVKKNRGTISRFLFFKN